MLPKTSLKKRGGEIINKHALIYHRCVLTLTHTQADEASDEALEYDDDCSNPQPEEKDVIVAAFNADGINSFNSNTSSTEDRIEQNAFSVSLRSEMNCLSIGDKEDENDNDRVANSSSKHHTSQGIILRKNTSKVSYVEPSLKKKLRRPHDKQFL